MRLCIACNGYPQVTNAMMQKMKTNLGQMQTVHTKLFNMFIKTNLTETGAVQTNYIVLILCVVILC